MIDNNQNTEKNLDDTSLDEVDIPISTFCKVNDEVPMASPEKKSKKNSSTSLDNNETVKNGFFKELLSWVIPIVISVASVVLIINFVARPVLVDGNSMYPTLHHQDRLITVTPYGDFHRGDIVAIKSTNGNLPLIKRVIGTEGDTIDIDYKNHQVILNGEPLKEDYIFEPMNPTIYQSIEFPITLKNDELFVLGDNRNNSDDSRDPKIGLIKESDVFGKAKFRFWPFESFGGIK